MPSSTIHGLALIHIFSQHASPAEEAGVIDLDVVDLDTLDQEEDITEDTGVINEEDED